tara:strand:+ start:7038 stop:7829 length:792 start_codon:yes stop_codon:yes gene_type:complete
VIKKNAYISFFLWLLAMTSYSQLLNKEIKAEIRINDSGEFIEFTALAENLTLADRSLQYEFSTFTKDENGNTTKNSQDNRFVLEGQNIKELSKVTVNKVEGKRMIILLIINDIDGKPLGQDRIVLNDDSGDDDNTIVIKKNTDEQPGTGQYNNQDMAKPQDGYFMEGLVVENSITKMGRDFYTLFYSKYYLSGLKSGKDIIIEEQPARGRVTRISVKVENQLVWQFFSNPSRDYLKQQAEVSFNKVLARLQQISKTQESITRY